MKINRLALTSVTALPLLLAITGGAMALDPSEEDYNLKLFGKYLFFDKISLPARQACASCHTPDAGWTNGKSGTNAKQVAVTGANPHTVGTLKPPSNAYASLIPDLDLVGTAPAFAPTGGNFWNGRAGGNEVRDLNVLGGSLDRYAKYLGPTADQAHASPFINPVEQGLPDIEAVCEHVNSANYAPLYSIAFDGALIDCESDVTTTFGRFALALAAYQHSHEVNAFDSKRDRALRAELACADQNGEFADYYNPAVCASEDEDNWGKFPLVGFTNQENWGHDLFYDVTSDLNPEGKRARCATFCHRSGTRDGTSIDERYTGDGYFNIGVPRNVEIPGNPDPNPGLKATSGDDSDEGLHKVPTLRNVDKRRGKGFKKAYTHNGWFKSLESLVHFYNTSLIGGTTADSFGITECPEGTVTEKDALAQNCWPKPEFDNAIIRAFVGNLGLTGEEEGALVAYLKTLSDIPTAKAPEPFNLKKFEKGQL